MCSVVDLDTGSSVDRLEREVHHSQLRSELFVRQTCHDDLAFGERNVCDGLGSSVPTPLPFIFGSISQRGLGELCFFDSELSNLATSDLHDHRCRFGTTSAMDAKVSGSAKRIDCQVFNLYVTGLCAQHVGQFFAKPFDIDRGHLVGLGHVTRFDSKDRCLLWVSNQEHTFWCKRHGSNGLQFGSGIGSKRS